MGPKWTCGTCDDSLTVAPFRAWRGSRGRSAQGLGPTSFQAAVFSVALLILVWPFDSLAQDIRRAPNPRFNGLVMSEFVLRASAVRTSRMAERVGFEPTVRCRTHAFQACTLSHSVISPSLSNLNRWILQGNCHSTRYARSGRVEWRRGWDSNPRASSRRLSAFEAPPL